ncbi:translocation/assembly module TamB domain-containing protein [Colwellia sp. MEBiC06753]
MTKLLQKSLLGVSVIIIFLLIMVISPLGLKLAVTIANLSDDINIGKVEGSLLSTVKVRSVNYQTSGFALAINNAELTLELSCLLQTKFCIENLAAELVDTAIFDNTESDNSESAETTVSKTTNASEKISLPLAITLKQLAILRGKFDSPAVSITLDNFLASARAKQSLITVNNASLLKVDVVTKASTKAEQVQNQDQPWPLANLPTINLPLAININQLAVEQITVNGIDLQTESNAQKETAAQAENSAQPPSDSPNNNDDITHYITAQQTQLAASWMNTKLVINKFSSQLIDYGKLSLSGQVDFTNNYPLRLTLNTELVNFALWPALSDTTQTLELSGDLASIGLNLQSKGNLALIASATADVTKQALPFDITLDANQFPLIKLPEVDAQPTAVKLVASGDILSQQFELQSKINGYGYQQAQLNLVAKHGDKNLAIEQLSFNDNKTQSKLAVDGNIDYQNNINWQLSIATKGFTFPQYIASTVTGRLSGAIKTQGNWQQQQWAISLKDTQLKGEVAGYPITIDANIDLNENWRLSPGHLYVSSQDSYIKINGLSDENWQLSGNAYIANIGQWHPAITGEVTSKFTVSGPFDNPNIHVVADINAPELASVSTEAIHLVADYQPLSNHQTQLQITSDQIVANELSFEQINLELAGNLEQHQLNASWQGDNASEINISGQWQTASQTWQGQISQANIGFNTLNWQLDHAVEISVNAQSEHAKLSAHCWQGESASLCFNQAIELGQIGSIHADITGKLAELGKLGLPEDLTINSDVTGQLNIDWQGQNNLNGSAKLSLTEGSILINQDEETLVPVTSWQDGALNISLANNQLETHFALNRKAKNSENQSQSKSQNEQLQSQRLQENTNSPSNLLPLIELTSNAKLDNLADISADLEINQFNIAPFKAFTKELSSLAGEITGQVTLSGELAKPQVNGRLVLNNGAANSIRTPSKIDNIALTVELTGNEGTIDGDIGLNNQQASINGKLNWQQQLAMEMQIKSAELSLALPPHITATIAPDLHIHLLDNNLTITGNLHVNNGELLLAKLPPGSVSVSDDVVFVDASGEDIAPQSKFSITTNINLSVADKFHIEGQGFNGFINGELVIRQEHSNPLQLFGTVKISNGRYKAYGQSLKVEKGQFSFNGAVDNPLIDLQAFREITKEDIRVGINIYGPVNSMVLTFFSSPSMSQQETLSYLIRGRGIDAGTSGDSTLGLAIGTTLANSTNIVESLEKIGVLNQIEIDGSDGQASISGYLGERVYIKYGVGVTEPINELTVRLYLFSRIWVETVSGLENSADIYYSYDIK